MNPQVHKVDEQKFFNAFLGTLQVTAVRYQSGGLSGVVWLDGAGRVNSCCIRYTMKTPPLVCIAINWKDFTLFQERGQLFGRPVVAEPPAWSYDLICLPSELPQFAVWLAMLVNFHEDKTDILPAPPLEVLDRTDSEAVSPDDDDQCVYAQTQTALDHEKTWVPELFETNPPMHATAH